MMVRKGNECVPLSPVDVRQVGRRDPPTAALFPRQPQKHARSMIK
jgi:hypothetical protein